MARDYFKENTRRNARRRMEAFREKINDLENTTIQDRKAAQKALNTLENAYKKTLARGKNGKKQTERTIQKNLQKLEKLNLKTTKEAFRKKIESISNVIMERQLSLATSKNKELSIFSEKKVRQFYSGHKRIWQGLPLEDRNKAIMDYWGTNRLQDAFNKYFSWREALSGIHEKMETGEELSDEDKEILAMFGANEGDETPDKYEVIMVSIVDAAIQNA